MSKKQAPRKEAEKPTAKKDSSKSLKGGVGENEEARLARQRELVDSLNRENMMRYLQGLAPSIESEGLVRQASSTAVQKVTQRLEKGQLSISENPPPLPPKGPPPLKLSPQEQLELQLKAQREQLQRKIDYLQEQIRSDPSKAAEDSPLQIELKQVLSKQQHERRVREIAAEKAERKRKQEQMQQQEERRTKEEREREEELKKIADQKQRQAKRKEIEAKMQARKQQHEQFIKQQSQLQKSLAAVKQKERLYERMEQRYQSEVVLPSLEEKKSRLKQLRDFHSRYDLEAVKEHEKQYRSAHSPKNVQQPKTHESTWVPPHRSEKMSKLLQEEEQMIKDKLQEKQRRAEDRARRQESFLSELKQKHQPKLDTEKRTQIQRRLQEQRKEQLRKKQRSSIDGRKLGQDYLELARKMGRSASLRTSAVQSRTTEQQLHTSRPDPSLIPNPHRSDEFYEQIRRRKIDEIVTASGSPQQKYHLLRMETQKLGEKIRQAEQKGGSDKQGQLLLSSIKAKMGIMQLMRNQ